MKKNYVFRIVLISVIIVVGLIVFVPRDVELPPVDDLEIAIHSGVLGTIELQDSEKNAVYKMVDELKYSWNPSVGNNHYYYSGELVTIFITGSNVPYSLTLNCFPKGESVYQRAPFAFTQTGPIAKYKFKDNPDLFSFLIKYCSVEDESAEENLQP